MISCFCKVEGLSLLVFYFVENIVFCTGIKESWKLLIFCFKEKN